MMDKPPIDALLWIGSYQHGRAMGNGLPSKLVAAAILYTGNELWIGTRHCDIIRAIIDNGREPPVTGEMQGFLTDTNMFVRRLEGKRIAQRAGQIINGKTIADVLTSEDLW